MEIKFIDIIDFANLICMLNQVEKTLYKIV